MISGRRWLIFAPFIYALIDMVCLNSKPYNDLDQVRDHIQATYFDREDTFEFIVGGGSAGCVVANRLSKQYKVLLLEAGGVQQPGTRIPATAITLLNRPYIDYFYKTVPQKSNSLALENKQSSWSAGRGLGGTSFLNFMIYLRGSPSDFNNWANITGDDSWSYENVLPHFRNLETYYGDGNSKDELHGTHGELPIQKTPYTGMADIFIKAAEEMGWPNVDLNSRVTEGSSATYNNIWNGRRISASSAFIEPIQNTSPNLTIYKFSQVEKILFRENSTKAYGVQYTRHGKLMKAFATKEVVISAGAINSPKLLMLSGIGPKAHLQDLGIDVKLNLPVGQGLQDHLSAYLGPFFVDKPVSMLLDRDLTAKAFFDYIKRGSGPLSSTGTQGVISFTSSYAKNAGQTDWPDIQYLLLGTAVYSRMAEEFARAFNVRREVLQQYYSNAVLKDSFHIFVSNSRPIQKGEIKLQSSNPNDDPLIDPKYLEEEIDVKILIEGMQTAIDYVENTTTFHKLNGRFTDQIFPGCEHVKFRSPPYWECYARHYGISLHHAVGTCQMGATNSKTAVVDSQLRVQGASNLRVIDASIMPVIPNSNTNAPTLMIGEKGAHEIIKYWSTISTS